MPENIFVYYRVSTEKQNEAGTRETQELAVRRFLKDKDVKVVQEFYDVMTGSSRDRPAYQEMLSRLDEVGCIAVFDIYKLSRDYEEAVNPRRLFSILKPNIAFIYLIVLFSNVDS
jgi:DNA invertase Pin-like site-specific DNA recombinase